MNKTIIVADDVEVNRSILCEIFKNDYKTIEASTGKEVMDILIKDNSIAIVLLDIKMPDGDGFYVLEQMKKLGFLQRIPVIFITSSSNEDIEKDGFDLGVTEIISKTINSIIVKKRVENTISLYEAKNQTEIRARKLSEKLQKMSSTMIDGFAGLVESRNRESGSHVYNIKTDTQILLDEYSKKHEGEFTPEIKNIIVKASALHDIGKIMIKEAILNKPKSAGRLTPEEFKEIQNHTSDGVTILNNNFSDLLSNDPLFYRYCIEICQSHHERWDGLGYPQNLKGNEIPFSAQIVSIADVYDALVSERCYKDAIPHEKAVEMINNNECGVFNPELLDVFNKVADKLNG